MALQLPTKTQVWSSYIRAQQLESRQQFATTTPEQTGSRWSSFGSSVALTLPANCLQKRCSQICTAPSTAPLLTLMEPVWHGCSAPDLRKRALSQKTLAWLMQRRAPLLRDLHRDLRMRAEICRGETRIARLLAAWVRIESPERRVSFGGRPSTAPLRPHHRLCVRTSTTLALRNPQTLNLLSKLPSPTFLAVGRFSSIWQRRYWWMINSLVAWNVRPRGWGLSEVSLKFFIFCVCNRSCLSERNILLFIFLQMKFSDII